MLIIIILFISYIIVQQLDVVSKKTPKDDDDTGIAIGTRVFLRNRGVRGRNKIQDTFLPAPYKVTERELPNVYDVEPLDVNGPAKKFIAGNFLIHENLSKAQNQKTRFPQLRTLMRWSINPIGNG